MRNIRIPQVFTLIRSHPDAHSRQGYAACRLLKIHEGVCQYRKYRKLYVWVVFSSEYIKKKNHR